MTTAKPKLAPNQDHTRWLYSQLPGKIIASLPSQKRKDIFDAMDDLLAAWEVRGGKPHRPIDFGRSYSGANWFSTNFFDESAVHIEPSDPSLDVVLKLQGKLGVYLRLFQEYRSEFQIRVPKLTYYEYLAVAISRTEDETDKWFLGKAQALLANAIVDWLIELRPTKWQGVEPETATEFKQYEALREREYLSMKEQWEKLGRPIEGDYNLLLALTDEARQKNSKYTRSALAKLLAKNPQIGLGSTQIIKFYSTHYSPNEWPLSKGGRPRKTAQ